MKILEIIPQLNSGGAERFVVDLCNELIQKHEVILIVLHSIDKAGFFAQEINPAVTVVSMNKDQGVDFGLFFRLKKLIHKYKPDVVHTHLMGIVYCFLAYLNSSGIKFIHTVHNDAAKEAGGGISKWCRKFAFKAGRVTPVTISEESQSSFVKFYGITPPLIYNGRPGYNESSRLSAVKQELEGLKTSNDSTLIVNIARLNPQKNQLSLANAVVSANKTGKKLDLAIVGREDDKIAPEIRRMESKHVHLLGMRTNPRDYMKAADAFCLSSVYEGMPITLIECFSVGVIPICTPVGGIINMIEDGINGILAKGTSEEDIYEALIRFLNMSEDEKTAMHKASLASFHKYGIENCAENYVKLMSK